MYRDVLMNQESGLLSMEQQAVCLASLSKVSCSSRKLRSLAAATIASVQVLRGPKRAASGVPGENSVENGRKRGLKGSEVERHL
eukprot:3232512-Pleurochrysis_carterae.AAC.2